MLKCMIIDDEPLALELLEDNIRQTPFLQLEASCRNALEALDILQQKQVDLIFSDIEMPGLDGIQFVNSLHQKPMIIFITAYEQYALKGYDLSVVDYLLKPVSFERFLKAANKAHEAYLLKNQQTATVSEEPQPFIFLQADYSLVKVQLDEVKYIEAVKDYIKIHYTVAGKRSLMVRISMKNIEDMLPASRFIRIHKSFIVSIGNITSIRKNILYIDELELPIGELYKDQVLALINKYT